MSVIILTMFQEESIFHQAMDLGTMGYILKDGDAAEIVRGIKTIVRGEYFISPALATVALKKIRQSIQILNGVWDCIFSLR